MVHIFACFFFKILLERIFLVNPKCGSEPSPNCRILLSTGVAGEVRLRAGLHDVARRGVSGEDGAARAVVGGDGHAAAAAGQRHRPPAQQRVDRLDSGHARFPSRRALPDQTLRNVPPAASRPPVRRQNGRRCRRNGRRRDQRQKQSDSPPSGRPTSCVPNFSAGPPVQRR